MSGGLTPHKVADHGFGVLYLTGANPVVDFVDREPANLDAFVFHGFLGALSEIGSAIDVHVLSDVAGAGPEGRKLGPVGGRVAGLFAQFAFGGIERGFTRIDAASGKLP